MEANMIRRRIKHLEAKTKPQFAEVLEWIRVGRFYDELTDQEKDRYCEYRGHDREAMEEIEMMVTGDIHFLLERKPIPPTKAQMQQIRQEIEDYIEGRCRDEGISRS